MGHEPIDRINTIGTQWGMNPLIEFIYLAGSNDFLLPLEGTIQEQGISYISYIYHAISGMTFKNIIQIICECYKYTYL